MAAWSPWPSLDPVPPHAGSLVTGQPEATWPEAAGLEEWSEPHTPHASTRRRTSLGPARPPAVPGRRRQLHHPHRLTT